VRRRAEAVFKVMRDLWKRASDPALGETTPAARGKFGPLALGLQVQGAIALADAPRHGLRLAPGAVNITVADLANLQLQSEAVLAADPEASRCFKMGRDGRFKYRRDGSPDVRVGEFKGWLRRTLSSMEGLHRSALSVALREDAWAEDASVLARCHPLLRAWSDLTAAAEILRSAAVPGVTSFHPRYGVLPELHS
jgi:hypothetical protein